MNNYLHRQFTNILNELVTPENREVPGGMTVIMENGDRFMVCKTAHGNISIFNCQISKCDYKTTINEPQFQRKIGLFFIQKFNWIAKIEPMGHIAKQVYRELVVKQLVLTNKCSAKLVKAFVIGNKRLRKFVVDIEVLPIPASHPELIETHQRFAITYYSDLKEPIEYAIREFIN